MTPPQLETPRNTEFTCGHFSTLFWRMPRTFFATGTNRTRYHPYQPPIHYLQYQRAERRRLLGALAQYLRTSTHTPSRIRQRVQRNRFRRGRNLFTALHHRSIGRR